MTGSESIPSPELPNALAAFDDLMAETTAIKAAVAFVTLDGVELLGELLKIHGGIDLEIVARGAPITDPVALTVLRDRYGAAVSVVAGPRAAQFHPKLWLLAGENRLAVISGSGNLTAGGLRGNREQFEVAIHEQPQRIEAEERRFEDLTEGAIPFDRFEGSIAWRKWIEQTRRRRELEKRLREMDEELVGSHVESREGDKQALLDDLWGIYHWTGRNRRLPGNDRRGSSRADGRVPRGRFVQALPHADPARDPSHFGGAAERSGCQPLAATTTMKLT